jgi:hypothetical protein
MVMLDRIFSFCLMSRVDRTPRIFEFVYVAIVFKWVNIRVCDLSLLERVLPFSSRDPHRRKYPHYRAASLSSFPTSAERTTSTTSD